MNFCSKKRKTKIIVWDTGCYYSNIQNEKGSPQKQGEATIRQRELAEKQRIQRAIQAKIALAIAEFQKKQAAKEAAIDAEIERKLKEKEAREKDEARKRAEEKER